MLLALEVLLKLGLAVILGGAIGWEREMHGRPAGARTHMLMVLGVTLLSEVSKNFGANDPSRIAAQIVTGVGFLGAGTILRMGIEIRGLTTAASIWAAASIGMAVSVGGAFYVVAVFATLLTLLTLTLLDRVEKRFAGQVRTKELAIGLEDLSAIPGLLDVVRTVSGKVVQIQVEGIAPNVLVRVVMSGAQSEIYEKVTGMAGVRWAAWVD